MSYSINAIDIGTFWAEADVTILTEHKCLLAEVYSCLFLGIHVTANTRTRNFNLL